MANKFFWKLVREYNSLMNSAVEGPDCTDLNICNGACCSIEIDVPKVLALKYIRKGYALKKDFIRGDVFSFKLRFDENTGKCFLFNKKINGCSVHNTGIKPPQCWIYPTNFTNPSNEDLSCKKASGWKIIDPLKAKKAEKLLKKYEFLCTLEANQELKKVKKRLENSLQEKFQKESSILKDLIKKAEPSRLGGFKDSWDDFELLPAEGFSLQMKKFCFKYNKNCKYLLNNDFLKCQSICEVIIKKLIEFLKCNIYNFIKTNGLDTNGEYPLYKLFEFANFT